MAKQDKDVNTKQVTLQDAFEYLYNSRYTGAAVVHLFNGKISSIHLGLITKLQIQQED